MRRYLIKPNVLMITAAIVPSMASAGPSIKAPGQPKGFVKAYRKAFMPRTKTNILPQVGGGHWRITTRVQGYTEFEYSNPYYGTWSYPDPDTGKWEGDLSGYMPIGLNGLAIVRLDGSGFAALKAVWVDSTGKEGAAATNPPPPSELRLKLSPLSEVVVSGGAFVVHSHKTNNGYNDPEIYITDSYNKIWRRNTKRLKTFKSSSGVVEFALPMQVGVEVQTNDFDEAQVWAWCDLGAELDNRTVDLHVAGYQNKRLKLTGQNVTYSITTSDGLTHTRSYPGTAQENTPVDDAGSLTTNGILYVGLPVVDQTIIANGSVVVSYPTVINDYPVAYAGAATQKNIPQETYSYSSDKMGSSGAVSGTLPSAGNSWSIPNYSVSYAPSVKLIKKFLSGGVMLPGSPTTEIVDAGISSEGLEEDAVRFKYTWADGVVGEAIRGIELKRSVEQVSILPVVIDPNVNRPWKAVPFKDGEWKEPSDPSGKILNGPRAAEWQYTAMAVAVATPFLSGPISQSVVLAGTICAVLEKSMELYAATEDNKDVFRGAYNSAIDIVYGQYGTQIPNPSTLDITNYKWKFQVRPKSHIFPIVIDRWGLGGYEGRGVVKHTLEDGPLDSPRRHIWLYKFQLGGAQP